MSRTFTISDGGVTIAGATTLAFVNPLAAPNVNLAIMRAWIAQSANATSAQQRVQLETQVTAFPTLTSATPSKNNKAEAASLIAGGTAGAAGTAGTNASAEGAGAKTVHQQDAFNVLNGFLYVPTPNEVIVMPAGFASGIGLFLPVAPTTLTNWAFGLVFQEV